jgi:hypothetical protein
MKNKGRNGKSVGVDGKTRNRITKEQFATVAFQCNGDVRKMAEEHNLNQPPQAIKSRYQNLVKKDFQLENKSLPEMVFKVERTHTSIDRTKLIEIAKLWNSSGGDAEFVAEKIGCSLATVLAKIRKLDDIFYAKQFAKFVEEMKNDNPGITDEDADELAQDKIDTEGFETPLCNRKVSQRGRASVAIDEDLLADINSLLENVPVPKSDDELTSEEIIDDISEMLS